MYRVYSLLSHICYVYPVHKPYWLYMKGHLTPYGCVVFPYLSTVQEYNVDLLVYRFVFSPYTIFSHTVWEGSSCCKFFKELWLIMDVCWLNIAMRSIWRIHHLLSFSSVFCMLFIIELSSSCLFVSLVCHGTLWYFLLLCIHLLSK